MVTAQTASQRRVVEVLAAVVDPEIPVLTIADLGVLREATVEEDGGVRVTITPTYSGCPALEAIAGDIVSTLAAAGYDDVEVNTVYAPAWTTDWLSEVARRKLNAFGIAPPGHPVLCPRCAGTEPRLVTEFGSTACKALMVCTSCGEPFDYFKEL